ncbi:hypothetical protein C922_05620 [Plasmodium inui San Antonio 1]|uniref:Uncharacterized protein n=1 Tax=Plasmodium inui San Antonio 1 TaxID=1237626 RepID=W6ZXG3_9APIC|nr:hypothetical protein C922_05620 [Plasmodium inui San Antonio 1]EUD63998.1 hypothetical protein C922_05620 [Plasmodium inui San Antonio 1]
MERNERRMYYERYVIPQVLQTTNLSYNRKEQGYTRTVVVRVIDERAYRRRIGEHEPFTMLLDVRTPGNGPTRRGRRGFIPPCVLFKVFIKKKKTRRIVLDEISSNQEESQAVIDHAEEERSDPMSINIATEPTTASDSM